MLREGGSVAGKVKYFRNYLGLLYCNLERGPVARDAGRAHPKAP